MPAPEWTFFGDLSGLWQWERRDSNGKLIAESSVGFPDRKSCAADAEKHGFAPDGTKHPK
jgi:hypothetical protein